MPKATVVEFEPVQLEANTARSLASGAAIAGTPVTEWWRRQSAVSQQRFMDAIRTSMVNGESSVEATTRVFGGTIRGTKVQGIMHATRAQTAALVQTALSSVTNTARLEAFKANTDVIKAVQQISTLDNKTTDICIAYSGDSWTLPDLKPIGKSHKWNGGCPRHFNCRSIIIPVTKSFRELGVKAAEVKGTRASMDGQVADDITFDQWLKTKSITFQNDLLTTAKAELWRKGRITLSQLLDFSGTPLTLQALEAIAAGTPATAAAAQAIQQLEAVAAAQTVIPTSAVGVRGPGNMRPPQQDVSGAPFNFAGVTERRVPVDQIRFTGAVDELFVPALRSYILSSSDDIVDLIRYKEVYFVIDGHHRVAAAKLRNEKTLRARVIEIP